MKEYRVAWTTDWRRHEEPCTSSSLPSLADAEEHLAYVMRRGNRRDVRIQVREWTDLPAPEPEPPAAEPTKVIDLMAALEASIAAAKEARSQHPTRWS